MGLVAESCGRVVFGGGGRGVGLWGFALSGLCGWVFMCAGRRSVWFVGAVACGKGCGPVAVGRS